MLDRDRFVVDDTVWETVAPLLSGKPTDPGSTGKDNRLLLEAMLWRGRPGVICPAFLASGTASFSAFAAG